jgi:hypothetical protein
MDWMALKSELSQETAIRHDRRSGDHRHKITCVPCGPSTLPASPEARRLNDLGIVTRIWPIAWDYPMSEGLVAAVSHGRFTQHAPPAHRASGAWQAAGRARPRHRSRHFRAALSAVLLTVGWFTLTCNPLKGRLRRVTPEPLSLPSAIKPGEIDVGPVKRRHFPSWERAFDSRHPFLMETPVSGLGLVSLRAPCGGRPDRLEAWR